MNSSDSNAFKPRKPLWFFVCLLILGAGVASFVLLRALKPAPVQRDPAQLVPVVRTTALEYRNAPLLIEGNGMVSPKAVITVAPQVNGEVIAIHSNLVSGGVFTAGEIIVQIDPRSFEANLAEAEANQAANRSSLTFINRQVARLESLRKDDFAGEETLDDAINRRDQTLAAIARQDAIIESRRLDLERTAIKAPFAGRVISENVDVGDIVSPGRELARFYASDEVEVVVSLNPNDSVFIPGLWEHDPGSAQRRRAWVSVDHGGRDYQWEGYVHRVEADLDRTTRTVDVVVRIPQPYTPGTPVTEHDSLVQVEAPPLLVGMYTTVDIEGATLAGHFVLPVSAVRNGDSVWVVTGEGKLAVEPVEFVRQEGNTAVLLAPQLPEGTPIIVSDIALVSDGMQVQTATPDLLESAGL